MEDKNFSITLKCLFCDCELEENSEKELISGDMINCQECGESNDYDALMEVASEKAEELVAEYAQSEIDKMLKKTFK